MVNIHFSVHKSSIIGNDDIHFSSIISNAASSDIQIFQVINFGLEIFPSNVNWSKFSRS
ncbi:MAG: hypothetical protein WCG25_05915 [bacterium]